MEKIRKHIIYRGYVQGVGFRYRAYYSARNFGVTGWVRNNDDGSVELEAEGTPKAIDDMLLTLEKNIYADITDVSSQIIPIHNDRSFEIIT